MDTTLILAGLLVFFAIYAWAAYNRLVTAKVRADQSLKDIDVQLKKRYDLLPDLVETAKKAAGLDERVFTEVARLRSEAMKAGDSGEGLAERARIENQISTLMRDIKVAVEAYPDIKSHSELGTLMESVTAIEEKIAYARQFYNSNVGDYNTRIRLFPAMILARAMGFVETAYFSAPEEEKKDVKVTF